VALRPKVARSAIRKVPIEPDPWQDLARRLGPAGGYGQESAVGTVHGREVANDGCKQFLNSCAAAKRVWPGTSRLLGSSRRENKRSFVGT